MTAGTRQPKPKWWPITAEAFADHLEAAAAGRAGDPRLKLAEREREIAALERRNAAKLRDEGVGPLHLETPPPLHDQS